MSITNAHAPRIETRTVELRALYVGNKQMTIAVFRQLPTFEIDDVISVPPAHPCFNVELWGYVAACDFVGCHKHYLRPHRHVIGTNGEILQKGTFYNLYGPPCSNDCLQHHWDFWQLRNIVIQPPP